MNLYGAKQLADGIRAIRRHTVLVAEDIHEDDYLFRPTVGSRSVAETLVHIALFSHFDYLVHKEEHVTTVEDFDFGQFLRDSESQEKKLHSKSQLIKLLRDSGESWAAWVELLPEPFLAEGVAKRDGTLKTRFEMILGTEEHEVHHHGQLTVIERMLGIVPPCISTNRRDSKCVPISTAVEQHADTQHPERRTENQHKEWVLNLRYKLTERVDHVNYCTIMSRITHIEPSSSGECGIGR